MPAKPAATAVLTLRGEDGVPLHWSPCVKKKIEELNLRPTCDHPGYSPDLNPIGNAFAEADKKLGQRQLVDGDAKTKEEMIERFEDALCDLQEEGFFLTTAESMPQRCRDVISANGQCTRW